MITLILGKKGTGKTKRLLDMCAKATEASNGCVVFIEKDSTLTFDLSHKTRLAVAEEYGIAGFEALFGYIAGMCAGNYDITDVFVDSTLKIGGNDMEALANFVEKLSKMADKASANIVMSISADPSEVPERLKGIVQEL